MDTCQFSQRVLIRADVERACDGHVSVQALGLVSEQPGDAAGGGDGDGAVAVFHCGVGLGPALHGFAHLKAGFVGQPNRPAGAEEGELLGIQEFLGNLCRHCVTGILDCLLYINVKAGQQVDQRRGSESGLHHGALIGVLKADYGVCQVNNRR
ncbi:hypothetical protein D3C73_1276220 [compost metagenome]